MKTQSSTTRKIVSHFWHQSLLERRVFILALIFIPVNALALNTFLPLFVGKLLASLGHGSGRTDHYLLLFIIALIFGLIGNFIGFKAYLTWQPRILKRLEHEAMEALLQRSVGFHNNHIAGKLVSDANDYTSAFMQLSNVAIVTILPLLLSLTSGIIVVFLNSVLLGFLILAMTVGVIAFALRQTARNTPYRDERHAARHAMVGHQADVITNAVTVKTFAHELDELKTGNALSGRLATLRSRDWNRDAGQGTRRIALLMLFETLFIVLIIHLVNTRPALLGIGIFTFSYVLSLGNRLFDIGTIFRTIEDNLLEATDMIEIVSVTPEIMDIPNAPKLRVDHGDVSFSKVVFRYQDSSSKDTVFDGLDITIKAGEKIGLVGHSGGGKSTLTRLLLRFEDIQAGSITIDGQDIAKVTQESLRQSIAYVPQEPLLFHRTILENIVYGKPGSSLDEVKAAAQKAYAQDFIAALPKKYDTIVGERGVKLSGGQRQRIAIARAMLKNAPILLLDEATSALDSESEVLIQEALWKLMEHRTAIVIAHRLSTIQKMDRILVMDEGKVVEQGSHKELLKQKGTYARLWAHQSGGFMED